MGKARWPRTALVTPVVVAGALLAAGCAARSLPANASASVTSSSASGATSTSSSAASDPPSSAASSTTSTTSSATSSATANGAAAQTTGQAMPKTGFGTTGPIAAAVVVFGAGLAAVSWRRWNAAKG